VQLLRGSVTSCPPGTEASQVTWIGTCRNPADGKDYIISYNDCCGKQSCAQCACTRNDSEEPAYRPFNNNDVNWCLAAKSHIYHCTVSIIRGVAV
jgi:methylamine dehydrogenase light chain